MTSKISTADANTPIDVREGRMLSSLQRIIIILFASSSIALAQLNSYNFTLDSIDSHVMMTIRTLSPVPCLGTSIRTQVQREGDTVIVIISGFVRPTPCIDGVEPASASISLGRELAALFYLRIREESADDLWNISRTMEGFQATALRTNFTSYLKK